MGVDVEGVEGGRGRVRDGKVRCIGRGGCHG